MKKIGFSKITTVLIILILMIIVFTPVIKANTDLSSDKLIIVNGKTITKNMKEADVNKLFGSPTIKSSSAYGGSMYSYTDGKTYYLYLETDENGKIACYGAIGGNFKAHRYKYGDEWDHSGFNGTQLMDNKNIVYGVFENVYTQYSGEFEDYLNRYQSNSTKYLYDVQKHCLTADKVICQMFKKKDFNHEIVPDEIFYKNEQLKYNGQSLYDYATKTSRNDKLSFPHYGTDGTFTYARLSPFFFCGSARDYTFSQKYMLYDVEIISINSSKTVMSRSASYYVTEDIFEEQNIVDLTPEETQKLENVKYYYNKYLTDIEKANQDYEKNGGSYFEVEPQLSSLPLKEGKLSKNVLEAATDYLNMARAGIGINIVSLDEDIVDAAQKKACLIYYMTENGLLDRNNPHNPDQIEGVSDEYYNKAMQYTENLFNGNVVTAIINALNDGEGDPIHVGHRVALLGASTTKWGTGCTGFSSIGWEDQAAQKFSGYKECDIDLVAWPANGITPMELITKGTGNWTALFQKDYTFVNETTVTIKCLNNGKVYEIKDNLNGKLLSKQSGIQLSFYDPTLTYQDGDVFEITFNNVERRSDKKLVDYSYRTVFKKIENESGNSVTDIKVDKENVKVVVGGSTRILAKAYPEDASVKYMTFKSSDENTVTVRQDGTITGLKIGTAKITIKCGNVIKEVNVEVTDGILGDVDSSGDITVSDAIMVLQHVAKNIVLTESQIKIADVDFNNDITVSDAIKILQYVAKNITSF